MNNEICRRGPRLLARLLCTLAVIGAAPAWADDAATYAGFSDRLDAIERSAGTLGSLEFSPSSVSVGALANGLRDPEAASEWIQENLTFDPYEGTLRASRGALFSMGGNSLDRALLLAEILDAMDIDARIAVGTLEDSQARALLNSAAVGGSLAGDAVPSEVSPYDAGANGRVRGVVSRHYWVRADLRSGTTDIDPTFPGLAFGEAATEADDEFAPSEVPENVTRRVTVGVYFETNGTDGGVALSHSAPLSELAYRNTTLTFEHTNNNHLIPVFDFAGSPERGSRIPLVGLQRVWVQVVFAIGNVERRVVRDLYVEGSMPDLMRRDAQVYSIVMTPGFVGTDYFHAVLATLLGNFGDSARSLRSVISDEIDIDVAQTDISPALATAAQQHIGTSLGIISLAFAHASDRMAVRIGRSMGVRPYYTEPRVIITSAYRDGATLEYQLDIRTNSIDAVPNAGVPASVVPGFRSIRGRLASALAGSVVERLTGSPAQSVDEVFAMAAEEGASVITVHPGTVRRVSSLSYTAEAVRRLTAEVNDMGNFAMAPNRVPAAAGGGLAWWRIVPTTGAILGVTEHGGQDAVTFFPAGFPESQGGSPRVQVVDAVLTLLDAVTSAAGTLDGDTLDQDALACEAACDVGTMRQSVCSDERERSVPRLSSCLRGASTRDSGSLVAIGTSCSSQLFTFYCGAATLTAFVEGGLHFEIGLSPGVPVPFASPTPFDWGSCSCE